MRKEIQRSLLAVPATSTHMFAKAAASDADSIFLDLEDAVAPDKKEDARGLAVTALNTIDWGEKLMVVRVNEVPSSWCYKDVIEVAEQCPRIDNFLIPKVSDASDVSFIEHLLDAIEMSVGRKTKIGLDILIETPIGLQNISSIAAASERVRSISFGVGDYSVDMKVPQTDYGTPDPDYAVLTHSNGSTQRQSHWNNQWHYAMARICNACRAHGIRPIDGPFTAINDPDGYTASARRARAMGFEGKWAIHPSQIDCANSVFSPSSAEVDWAMKINAAMTDAIADGKGAIQVDGHLIDLAHVRQAESVHSRHQAITAMKGRSAAEKV